MTYQFDTNIAALYGVDESIMIANLQFWIRKNEANGKHFHDGRFWTYNSIDAFTKLFPFWTSRQIRRILKSLEEKGVIVTGNYNTSAYDRTTWYAFGDSFLLKGQNHFTETSNGNDETGKPVINNETDIKPDNKPNETADGVLFPGEPVVVRQRKQPETHEPRCHFSESKYNRYEDFAAQFTEPEFANIDIAYYHKAVADWSAADDRNKKNDWIATARNFMRSDMEKKKLHTIEQAGAGFDFESAKRYLEMGMD